MGNPAPALPAGLQHAPQLQFAQAVRSQADAICEQFPEEVGFRSLATAAATAAAPPPPPHTSNLQPGPPTAPPQRARLAEELQELAGSDGVLAYPQFCKVLRVMGRAGGWDAFPPCVGPRPCSCLVPTACMRSKCRKRSLPLTSCTSAHPQALGFHDSSFPRQLFASCDAQAGGEPGSRHTSGSECGRDKACQSAAAL